MLAFLPIKIQVNLLEETTSFIQSISLLNRIVNSWGQEGKTIPFALYKNIHMFKIHQKPLSLEQTLTSP